MPKALVLGVNGQDGSFAAEALLRRGYAVVGVARQSFSRYAAGDQFTYEQLDLGDAGSLASVLRAAKPDFVFHMAAVHGSAGFQYEPVFESMLAVNVAAVHAVLEYARTENAKLRLVYGNSAKILAAPLHGEINESWPTAVSCLYSLGKMSALELIRHYRRHHGIKAANLVLFNHESARRPKEYFLPTVAAGLSRARRDRTHVFAVKTLDFLVDWSSAQELMDISVDIAEQAPDQDFVLASGRTVHARQVVEAWFQRHGLDYRRHVSESLATAEPGPAFRVDTTFLQQRVGRRPVRDLDEILDEIDSAADTGA